ncbi:MAG: aminotransferase class III-fold pyridoxal phosphate-dependent enzyme, partial [Cyclobacteriaceae bacterium]|nr:aminotransferase class III-fold pyridoxal phosphate-dependent enzyme [Cyclobacteriaceae bacterium]
TARFNDLVSVDDLINKNRDQVAAIIVEPVAGNMGCVLPAGGFLQGLRKLSDEHGIVLIFDEVMTGFRLSPGGAQELYQVKPDLTTLGKIIGGGMPVGAYGGSRKIMEYVSPSGPVYQAGTLSGNPMAMHAGYVVLQYLQKNPSIYDALHQKSTAICTGIKENLEKLSLDYTINQAGSMFTLFFNGNPVENFDDARKSDLKSFGKYFNIMLGQGIYLAPSQFEALFVSNSVEQYEIDRIVDASLFALKEVVE